MTDHTGPPIYPSFGTWVVVTSHSEQFPEGTKALVTGSAPDFGERGEDHPPVIEVSRVARNGHHDAVRTWMPAEDLTTDLTWRPLREERAIQAVIEQIVGVTGSRIDRAAAAEILDAVDDIRTGVEA